jgi:hypothetical protein
MIWELLEDDPTLLTPQGAEDWLRQIDSCIDLLRLYKQYFPDDFGEALQQRASLIPEPECIYSRYEEAFFAAIDTHLFPLSLDWIGDDDERIFAYHIPIAPFGLDFEGGDIPLGWLLLLSLFEEGYEDQLRQYGLGDFAIPQEGEVIHSLLAQRSAAQAGPIANLPYALQMLFYETDTVWLDMSNLEVSQFCWSKEEIDHLHQQYCRAKAIEEKALAFCKWLSEKPVPRFSMVVRLWNSCITPKGDPEPSRRIVSASEFRAGIDAGSLFGRHIALPAYRKEDNHP